MHNVLKKEIQNKQILSHRFYLAVEEAVVFFKKYCRSPKIDVAKQSAVIIQP
jgi:urease beta subunit